MVITARIKKFKDYQQFILTQILTTLHLQLKNKDKTMPCKIQEKASRSNPEPKII